MGGTDIDYYGDWALAQCAIRGVSFREGALAAECLHNRRWVKLIGLSLPNSSFTVLGALFFSVLGCLSGMAAGGVLGMRSLLLFLAFAGTWIFGLAAACIFGVMSACSRALISLWAENPKLVAELQPQVEQQLRQLV